jgi:PAS domain S-box-containing protein
MQGFLHFATVEMTLCGEVIFVKAPSQPTGVFSTSIPSVLKFLRTPDARITALLHASPNNPRPDRMNERFEDRAALLEAIISSSEDVILTKDLDGTVTSWNPAATRTFGYLPEEIIGTSILRLIPDHLHGEEREFLRRIRAGNRIEHFETTRLTKDGRAFEVSLTISPLKDSSGKIIGASKILRDISDRKRMETSLLQAEKIAATGRMAATIAHEINNPLEGLMNLIYLAKTSTSEPDQVAAYLTTAEEELERLAHISKQTLGFYREHASPLPVSLSRLVEDALAIYEPRLKHNDIELRVNLQAVTPILLKRGELMQVISNLVVNSIYAMANGGVLTVNLYPTTVEHSQGSRSGVALDIEDSGIGIPAEHLARVFEPFFTTRGEIGTGIGLWIAKQFVEGHDGTISATSSCDPKSHGTKMSLFLPWVNSYSVATGMSAGRLM